MSKKNICECQEKEKDTNFIKKKLIFQAIEVSLLLVGAFIFYDIINFFKKSLINFVHGNKYWFHSIKIILHILFVFVLDIFLRYTFAFAFNTPL